MTNMVVAAVVLDDQNGIENTSRFGPRGGRVEVISGANFELRRQGWWSSCVGFDRDQR